MRADLHITSAANPRLKALVKLRRRRARDEAGVTLVEGYEEVELAQAAGVVPHTVFYCTELMLDPDRQRALLEAARGQGSETISLSRAAFEKVSYREGPDGFLAVLPSLGTPLTDLALGDDPLVIICEGLEKPGNLGSVLRTADAAGVSAVIAADPITDWGNPNVVRASKGTVFSVPVAAGALEEVLAWAKAQGLRLVATTPDTTTRHTDADLSGPLAIVVGTEKYGLTDSFLAAAAERVRIPMAGEVNSLNAGVAAAIVVYEAVRQRG